MVWEGGPLPEGLRATPLPPWQLAVFRDTDRVPRFLRLKDIFIQPASKRWMSGTKFSGEAGVESLCYKSNLEFIDGTLSYVDAAVIDLLEDYAQQAALIPWKVWGPATYLATTTVSS